MNTDKSPKREDDKARMEWLRLIRTDGVGPVTFYRLLERYGTAGKALEALPEAARKAGRKKPYTIPPLSKIEKEYAALLKFGGDIVLITDEAYPLPLTAIDDAPPVLTYKGDLSQAKRNCIAMVGARNASVTGKKCAYKLAKDLGQRGYCVVSGFARGIDTSAHNGALETGTIAVMAGGLDVIYPQENQKLRDEITATGLIIAESAFGQQPFAQSFPRRNRIVSGLSQGVVVVEASPRSGSLITARMAGEQGRDVFAVPGHPFDPRAEGPNRLIRDGAVLVRHAEDITAHLESFSASKFEDSAPFTPFDFEDEARPAYPQIDETDIFDMIARNLSIHPIEIDELARTCELNMPVMQSALLDLELAGRIQYHPGHKVSLAAGV